MQIFMKLCRVIFSCWWDFIMSCSVWNDVQLQLLLMLSQSQGKTSNADRKKLFKELQLRSLAHFQDGVTTSVFFFPEDQGSLFFSCFFLQQVRCNFEIWQSPAFLEISGPTRTIDRIDRYIITLSHTSIWSINKNVGTGNICHTLTLQGGPLQSLHMEYKKNKNIYNCFFWRAHLVV